MLWKWSKCDYEKSVKNRNIRILQTIKLSMSRLYRKGLLLGIIRFKT